LVLAESKSMNSNRKMLVNSSIICLVSYFCCEDPVGSLGGQLVITELDKNRGSILGGGGDFLFATMS
jgi:hypothetical protein